MNSTVEQTRFLTSAESLTEEAKKTTKYSPNERAILTIKSPESLLSINCKATYDILTQIDIGERKNRQDLPTVDGPEPGQDLTRSIHPEPCQEDPTTIDGPGDKFSLFVYRVGMFAEALLVCLTGALHAIAWNSHFPTDLEHWFWRISSVAMCFCCLGIFFIANLTEYEQDLIAAVWEFYLENRGLLLFPMDALRKIHCICVRHATVDGRIRKRRYICHQLGILTALFLVSVYMFSVIFLTVESYLCLRTPLPGYFVTPSWTNFLPHL